MCLFVAGGYLNIDSTNLDTIKDKLNKIREKRLSSSAVSKVPTKFLKVTLINSNNFSLFYIEW